MAQPQIIVCPYCTVRILPTGNGTCPACRCPAAASADTGPHEEPATQLIFYCRECDFVFQSASDNTGYEQTICPQCSAACMTVAFEQEEKQRHQRETLLIPFLGTILGALGFHLHAHVASEEDEAGPAARAVTLARYADRSDAENDARALAREGITARIEMVDVQHARELGSYGRYCVALLVSPTEASRARRILRALDPPLCQEPRPAPPRDAVHFACQECGKMLTFPPDRRGKVETCPYCREFVDVPE